MTSQLRGFRLPPGAPVLLHTSLRKLGLGRSGAPALYQALLQHANDQGSAVVTPSFTYDCEDPAAWLESPPSPELLAERQASTPPYDRLASPVHRELGYMPEYVRSQPGSHRSNHPVLSFAAFGPHATEAVARQRLHFPLGTQSPLGWLCDQQGVVLMIGTDLTTMTLIHLAETTTPTSYVRATCRRVRSAAGWVWYWGAPSSCSDGFTKAAAALERATLARGKLGAAETCVVSAADLVESIRGKLISDPAWLLCDRPGCRGCGLARQYLAGEIDHIISGDLNVGDNLPPDQPLVGW